MTAKWIKASGEILEVEPEDGLEFTLDELRRFVGGHIEIIHPKSSIGALLVVNEEGKLRGLPINKTATDVWRDRAGHGDYIVGDVLLCRPDQIS